MDWFKRAQNRPLWELPQPWSLNCDVGFMTVTCDVTPSGASFSCSSWCRDVTRVPRPCATPAAL